MKERKKSIRTNLQKSFVSIWGKVKALEDEQYGKLIICSKNRKFSEDVLSEDLTIYIEGMSALVANQVKSF